MSRLSIVVNELQLPAAFVDAVGSRRLRRSKGSWQLREFCDSYGNPLEAELGQVYETAGAIKTATDSLASQFQASDYYGNSLKELAGPGAVTDILDFSLVLCFGIASGGEPFCLDYREDIATPSVVWWDDVYWRKISPDFDGFISLFDIPSS